MAKKEETVEGTVCKPILHEGKHRPVGSDLELPLSTASMLENSKRFTTDEDERVSVKKRAKLAAKAKASENDSASRIEAAETAASESEARAKAAEARAETAEQAAKAGSPK